MADEQRLEIVPGVTPPMRNYLLNKMGSGEPPMPRLPGPDPGIDPGMDVSEELHLRSQIPGRKIRDVGATKMATSQVRAPDGRVLTVEHEAGATPEQIKALARKQAPATMAEVVKPDTANVVKPSVGGFLKEGVKQRAGDIGATIASAAVPGGPLVRSLAAGVGQTAGDVAARNPVSWKTPLYGLATNLVGEGVTKAAGTVLSPTAMRAFAGRTVTKLADALDREVSAWRDFGKDAKGLYERAHGTGQRLLSNGFEQAIRKVKGQIPETTIVRVPEMIETAGRMEMTDAPRNARALIDDLPTLRKAGGKPYRQALKALSEQLPDGVSAELDAARREYKVGAGFIEIAEKGKFLHGEQYDPAKAMAALDRFGKGLLNRGMDEILSIIRGPGKDPIKPVKHNPFVQRIEGTLAGGGLGAPFGIPHALGGAAGGLAAATMLPRTTYKNVPLSPLMRFAGQVAPATIAEGGREVAREFRVPEMLQ